MEEEGKEKLQTSLVIREVRREATKTINPCRPNSLKGDREDNVTPTRLDKLNCHYERERRRVDRWIYVSNAAN